MTLPDHITDALEIVLITKDNLASYHHRLAEHFILAGWWGKWIGRWTADENLHAFALRGRFLDLIGAQQANEGPVASMRFNQRMVSGLGFVFAGYSLL